MAEVLLGGVAAEIVDVLEVSGVGGLEVSLEGAGAAV